MMFALTFSPEIIVVGALAGMAYAVLAAGLVLVYRATGVINFAHGEIGAFGAAVLAKLVLDFDWNFWFALVVVLVGGGALGALIETTVIRRLARGPKLAMLVATIGIAQLLLVAQLLLPRVRLENAGPFPSPLGKSFTIGNLVLNSPHFMIIAFVPAVVVGLGMLLQRTPWGLAIRAAADNRDAAELAAISTRQVSTMVWVLAGVLSTLTVILVNPLRNVNVGGLAISEALGPGLLLRALAAALVGRLVSLPLALVGGIGIGIVEALVFANVADPSWSELLLFLLVLTLVLVRGGDEDQETGLESLGTLVRPVPERLRQIWWIRRGGHIAGLTGIVIAALLPVMFGSASQTFLFGRMLVFAIVGLSVTMLTGWSGQLSLGQFAMVGVGAMTTVFLHDRGMPYGAALAYSVVAGALVALLVGFPALRLRGLYLAVTTLSFAVAAREWFFTQPWFLGDGSVVFVQPGTTLGVDYNAQKTFYLLCLAGLVVAVVVTSRLRSSGVGRSIIAVRDNERAAASFGISPAATKLLAFAVPGAMAAFAGSLLAGLTVQFGPDVFSPADSLAIVGMAVIGGLGSITGAVLGAVYVVGLPALLGPTPAVSLATSGIGLLVLLLFKPGGFAQIVFRTRDLLIERLVPDAANGTTGENDETVVLDESDAAESVPARPERAPRPAALGPVLAVDRVTVRFGGLVALAGVSLHVDEGEIVGLIGTNGAGKSTLMDVVSGFTPADTGTVLLAGRDVTELRPHVRARLGMGRVFQDARLFPGLTVREALQTALESDDPSDLVPVLASFKPARAAEARKAASAKGYLSLFGLSRYADVHIADLSTGTRRIVEMACLSAQGSQLLLLDEPTAGVAQRESEAMAPMIRRVQQELGASVLVIEHDMPMIMGLSDRVYCLAAGAEIASGSPEDVRHDPEVVAAYLGTDDRAIDRSDAAPRPEVTA
ncbi:ABC transporter permease subunit [Actinospongicola halichondriae]|uniref:ABC transporter permease subunit n=1 Tax=Actinospongicola halichondriae TaxID=3236844 RepID=UPI003D3D6D47